MSYQPFPIVKFETGLFNYYQPWISPEDAFSPLKDAFVFRGQVAKRSGRVLFGLTGLLRYTDTIVIATGNGTAGPFSGTIANHPFESGTVSATVTTSAGNETFSDNGSGTLTGSLGDTGTVNYTTGAWTLTFGGGRTVTNNTPMVASYTYTPASLASATNNPITMIAEFVQESNDTHFVIVNDTRRSAIFNGSTELFDPINTFKQDVWQGNGSSVNFTFSTVGWTNIAPYSVSITDGTNTITDVPGTYPAGGFTTAGNFAAGSTINYSTGAISINLTAAPASTVIYTMTSTLQGDYYTGARANLFNFVNWKASDTDTSHIYMTNNVDQITLYDGTNLSRPPLGITLAHVNAFVNDIKTALAIEVYQDSLLLGRPTLVGATSPEAQSIRWSAVKNPTNFAADVSGNGGELSAYTPDWLMSISYLRDALIVECENSNFLFRYTGSGFSPFRFDKINSTKSCNAPYGSVEYDTRVTSMGVKGLCFCDGVNKERYDLEVIDLYNDIDEDNFALCQGIRFDEIQQTWMIYPSVERDASNTNCDKILVYNWLEETWAVYTMNLTCIGLGRTFQDKTWNDFSGQTWNQAFTSTWDEFFSQSQTPWLLGGDANGYVFFLNHDVYDWDKDATNNQGIISSQLVSNRWNPFAKQGQKARFGYIDLYYFVNASVKMTINFYANNSTAPCSSHTLTLDAVGQNQKYAWKRVIVNLTGEFLAMEIVSSDLPSEQGDFVLLGSILWAKPAGRLTPGTFL